jgi:hypothetical protein
MTLMWRLFVLPCRGGPSYDPDVAALRLPRAQLKYDKLGATEAAVTLLAHDSLEVQFEALQLLEEMLRVSQGREVAGRGLGWLL